MILEPSLARVGSNKKVSSSADAQPSQVLSTDQCEVLTVLSSLHQSPPWVPPLMQSHSGARRRAFAEDPDAAVRATNDDAFVSKQCAQRAGYFTDPYLEALASHLSLQIEVPSRPPLINRGTAARVMFKSALIDAFLDNVCDGAGLAQIVSLGAGYDSLPFTLFKLASEGKGSSLHYVELDLSPVVSAKAEAVRAEPALRGLFKKLTVRGEELEGVVAGDGKSRYSLAACDLRDAKGLGKVLDAAGLRRDRPTLVVAEIVLVYLEPARSDAVIRSAGQHFSGRKVFVNIEHVHPDDAFGAQMVKNIATRGSPLLGIKEYPTLRSQKNRFMVEGWPHVEALTMLEAFRRKFSTEESIRLNRIELLDEVEEWNMLMEHYGIVAAVDGCGEDGGGVLAELLESAFSRMAKPPVTNGELRT